MTPTLHLAGMTAQRLDSDETLAVDMLRVLELAHTLGM
jgi:hypothetical protein